MSVESIIDELKRLFTYNNKSECVPCDYDEYTPNEYKRNYSNASLEKYTAQYLGSFEKSPAQWKIVIIFLYCLIIVISFFGNSIVCKIVFGISAMRSTTNIYIGSLSISDILITIINIPLQLTQVLTRHWTLGQFLCKCLPFFQSLSVNVSSFTMACIALERFQVVAYPLKPRVGVNGIILKIIFIWIIAAVVSSPYPALANVEKVITYSEMTRCRLIYPHSTYLSRQMLTVISFVIQYLAPLCITGITYYKICFLLWHRKTVGVVSERQKSHRYTLKWKTIRMLIAIFLTFAICWLPLNLYHIYQDFQETESHDKHNPVIFLACHWFAMSSACCNPFLYWWLNDAFRSIAKTYISSFFRIVPNPNKIESNYQHTKQRIKKTLRNRQNKSSVLSESFSSSHTSRNSFRRYKDSRKSCIRFVRRLNDKCLENNYPYSERKPVETPSKDTELKEYTNIPDLNWENVNFCKDAQETIV